MSEKKKDLKAFLAKQTKKGKKTTAAAAEPEKTVEEEKTPQAEVTKNKEQNKNKAENEESSDEEVDDERELEAGMNLGFAKIKELKDVKVKEEIAESEKIGFGFENDNAKSSGPKKQSEDPIKRNTTGGEITFGSRPMKFGRRKVAGSKFADDFNDDLGDLGDDGKIQKKNKNTEVRNEVASNNMVGGREWVNLGAGARDLRDQDEETKTENRVPGVKPTFKRRIANKGTGAVANDNDDSIRPSYDFKVSYKTSYDDNEKGPDGEIRERKPRELRDKGVAFSDFQKAADDNDDEEGFQIIRGREKKVKTANADDSDEDGGFQAKRNDGDRSIRGGGGRGGFFKNSSKRTD